MEEYSSFDIQDSQRSSLVKMLQFSSTSPDGSFSSSSRRDVCADGSSSSTCLHTPGRPPLRGDSNEGGSKYAGSSLWKILIYDSFCQDIIAPTLKVGNLRQLGVTLHLHISGTRSLVNDVPAVYFIEPTEENIKKICEDFKSQLYHSYYINFSSSVSKEYLKMLAEGAVNGGCVHSVCKVYDRFLSFVSLSKTEFSLNLPDVYSLIHGTSSDMEGNRLLQRIVDGIFSVVMTLGVIPVIRCPENLSSSATLVAKLLEKKLADSLQDFEDFNDSYATYAKSRPLLIILDRDIDMVVMLHHTWTYQSMLHDIFSMSLGRVEIPVNTANNSQDKKPAKPETKVYHLESANDEIWSKHCSSPLPEAAEAISAALRDYQRKMEDLNAPSKPHACNIDQSADTQSLLNAMSAIPVMTEKKRGIDMHTNIASALIKEAKARSLDRLFMLEDSFDSLDAGNCLTQLENISKEGCLLEDRVRALLCLYFKPGMHKNQEFLSAVSKLESLGWIPDAKVFLDQWQSLKSVRTPYQQGSGPAALAAKPNYVAGGLIPHQAAVALGGLGNKVFDKGKDILQDFTSFLKQIKSSSRIAKIVEPLMEQKANQVTESFIYLDPKYYKKAAYPKLRSSFKEAIVFVVGGGNCVEAEAMQTLAKKQQKRIIYGSTDFVTPSKFLQELSFLGQQLRGNS